MAFKGKGLFSKRQPIRTIAVFPSYDVMGFAVHESTGITSLDQIRKERIPLRVSTGTISKTWVKYSPTMFTVSAVMTVLRNFKFVAGNGRRNNESSAALANW